MRIISLLPGATEILFAIGAGDSVVGVTHECDFPPAAKQKPVLIRPRVDPAAAPAEVDRQVRQLSERGESIYAVDADLLLRLAPDLIVTQDLCHVCAASPEDLAAALAHLPQGGAPRVVSFTPHTLADVWSGIVEIGLAAGRPQEGQALAQRLAHDVGAIASSVGSDRRPRALCLEWFDPPYIAGHWVPEMVRLAGGQDVLGREGESSTRVTWQEILHARPDVIVLMSCGYDVQRNLAAWSETTLPEGWSELPAVADGRIYAVDANAYFSRPGPRLAQGVALLSALFHPAWNPPEWARDAVLSVQQVGIAAASA